MPIRDGFVKMQSMSKTFCRASAFACAIALPLLALAGPPFLSDDPTPTDYQHFEAYLFGNKTTARDGISGDAGVDFNYGATPDLQLTAVLLWGYERANGAHFTSGLGNIELAAKYRFLHQEGLDWDVAVFPRLFLPSGSSQGERHASLLIPIWLGKNWGDWSTFGGGGCALNRGGDSQDYCIAGWALTRRLRPDLQLGAELYFQSADTKGASASTTLGFGATYDFSARFHALGYVGSGLKNAAETGRTLWYASFLFTF